VLATQSIVAVLSSAPTRDLTTLATVKSELGIVTGADDAKLRRWIADASEQITDYLHRNLASESVQEIFRLRAWSDDPLILSRRPVSAISSVTIDGDEAVDPSLYELDAEPALLYLLDPAGFRREWHGMYVRVLYTAGYELLTTLPRSIERACLILLRHRQATGDRDPTIRQENVAGVLDTQYWIGGLGEDKAMPPEACALLDPYREIPI
jgi:hypothetical protein